MDQMEGVQMDHSNIVQMDQQMDQSKNVQMDQSTGSIKMIIILNWVQAVFKEGFLRLIIFIRNIINGIFKWFQCNL